MEPRSKTIYFKKEANPYTFTIMHGTGQFRVKLNDTSLADKKLVGRELQIIPKATGALNISIYDENLVDAPVATGLLQISAISSLVLQTPVSLIEQDTAVNMTIRANDNLGKEFDEDQYAVMKFDIQTEMTAMHSKDDLSVQKLSGRLF